MDLFPWKHDVQAMIGKLPLLYPLTNRPFGAIGTLNKGGLEAQADCVLHSLRILGQGCFVQMRQEAHLCSIQGGMEPSLILFLIFGSVAKCGPPLCCQDLGAEIMTSLFHEKMTLQLSN